MRKRESAEQRQMRRWLKTLLMDLQTKYIPTSEAEEQFLKNVSFIFSSCSHITLQMDGRKDDLPFYVPTGPVFIDVYDYNTYLTVHISLHQL